MKTDRQFWRSCISVWMSLINEALWNKICRVAA